MRLPCLLVLVSVLPASPTWCPGSTADPTTRQVQGDGAPPATPPPQDVPVLLSVDRLRRAMAEQPSEFLKSTIDRGVPVFRVQILGVRLLPDFKETLRQEWQPIQPGLLYHNEFVDTVTPFQA